MELVSGGTAEKDFYSHAREGRDEGNLKLVRSINISTHTPARGVTASYADCRMLLQISTHTPARGVTLIVVAALTNRFISTHTPARGVTSGVS